MRNAGSWGYRKRVSGDVISGAAQVLTAASADRGLCNPKCPVELLEVRQASRVVGAEPSGVCVLGVGERLGGVFPGDREPEVLVGGVLAAAFAGEPGNGLLVGAVLSGEFPQAMMLGREPVLESVNVFSECRRRVVGDRVRFGFGECVLSRAQGC